MKRREYIDPTSRQNVSRLQSDLSDISDIMKSNITEVLDRGVALDDMSRTSQGLLDESKKFEVWSRKLNLMKMWQEYAPCIVIGGLVVFVLWYKIFW